MKTSRFTKNPSLSLQAAKIRQTRARCPLTHLTAAQVQQKTAAGKAIRHQYNFSEEFALFNVKATARIDIRRKHACLVESGDIFMKKGRGIRQGGENSAGTLEETPARHGNKEMRFENRSLRVSFSYLLMYEENTEGLLNTAGG